MVAQRKSAVVTKDGMGIAMDTIINKFLKSFSMSTKLLLTFEIYCSIGRIMIIFLNCFEHRSNTFFILLYNKLLDTNYT